MRAAIKANRISVLPDGRIDPVAARNAWIGSTDPARSKVRTSSEVRTRSAQQGAHPTAQVRTEDEARDAISLIARVLGEEGVPDDGKGIDFGKARTAELILKARQRSLDQAEQEGRLVDRSAAEKLFFETARDMRDAWLSWPARIGIELADELGIDARFLTPALTRQVHRHLAEMGEPPADLGPAH
ncbi:hypothetical protein [Methylobacterium segetis]|uniref:hypothetical protein n=2 Tax=Methylobacterium segetis TaxID=2488750 RepID=UPI001FE183A8|nr:hypothetical protein [Methylobacterium segetis]